MAELVRTHCRDSLISKIAGFRHDDKFCDVDLHVDGSVFKGHRLILSAASSYFDKMFNGTFKESTEKKVTLRGIEANKFERILELMYTGDAVVHSSDVYDTIWAADFYGLPFVVELCAEIVEENLNALANDILKIYSLAHRMGPTKLVELLCKHIHQNFCYFVRRPEFFELTFESFEEVLELIEDNSQLITHDVFLEGIHAWISHQAFSTPGERESCLVALTDQIDFSKLSVEYTRYRITRSLELVPSQSMHVDEDVSNVALVPVDDQFLHAYVSRNSADDLPIGVSIFTAYLRGGIDSSDEYIWVYSGELGCTADFMRNLCIDNRLYSLSYLKNNNRPSQTFCSTSSVLMYPSLTLKPPPCILDEFDICGAHNNIYAYNKDIPPITEYSGFSQEELSRGMYIYKRDVDRWLPIPSPKTRFIKACMTCNDEGIVYLIGGRNSNRSVEVYDPRAERWSALYPTTGVYEEAACCAHGNELFVAGGIHNNSTMMETYKDGNWTRLKDLRYPRTDKFQLINWYPQLQNTHELLTFNRTLTSHSKISCLNSSPNEDWYTMPKLYRATRKTKLAFDNLNILDMINFLCTY